MKAERIVVSGFGGQGIVAAGRLLAYAGMKDGKKVSMLPSYGPEMRGGFANCHVIISDSEIASPIVLNAHVLLAMSLPALEKFESQVNEGGILIVDSHQIKKSSYRKDISVVKIPATKIAIDEGNIKLSNMVMLGALIKVIDILSLPSMESSIKNLLPKDKQHLFPLEMRALRSGMDRAQITNTSKLLKGLNI